VRRLIAGSVLALLVLASASSAGAGGHGGWRGHGRFHSHGPRVFIGGTFGFPLWPYYRPYYGPPYYASPYYASPYYIPYPVYPPPPPPPADPGASASPDDQAAAAADDDARTATYGLVQLRGVPDGAAVDLDGRFWIEANDLDRRWLALPNGRHTLTVRVAGAEPVERTLDVTAGRTSVVRVGPFPRARS
jgi:hypothetical protein